MIRVHIVVEGQTEEGFISEVLGPALYSFDVYPTARLIGKPGHKGGRVTYARARQDIILLLKQDPGAFCTTLFDFYGLGGGFPGTPVPTNLDNLQKVTRIEEAVKAEIVAALPMSLRADARFIPYLQLHEYEGLLFSDPSAFATGIQEPNLGPIFQQIREQFPTPEDINDGPNTAPSKRVLAAHPPYRKPLYGALAAISVGVTAMRRECPHFNQWVCRLEALAVGRP